MPEFTLTLNRSATEPRTACAWYLASPDSAEWLREIAGWNVPQTELRLIPIPASGSNTSATGVLIVTDELGVKPSARCTPYTRIAPRAYVPLDAQLQPQLDERELIGLLDGKYVYVWHPGVGFIAAEEPDVLRLPDLLAAPRRGERRWNLAVPGLTIGERLMMLTPVVELSFQRLLDESRGDIGTEQNSLADLPQSPAEPGDSLLDRAARAITLGMAGALYSLTKMFPTGTSRPTWIDRLMQFAAARMNRTMTVQEQLRHREISRLLHLLEHDPDKGLKFALPLADVAHRGLAPPSNRLGARNVEFDLRRLGGGRPTDFWNLGAQYRQQLLTKYRELANREMHLGRHRRAAYIFAELLGDLEAAALALANGHHYREAAIIYRDRLHRPLEAAKCLESGGLWSEAIEQYEELNLHEQVGTLYDKLGDTDKAGEAYRKAARRCRDEHDFLSAARIWDERLSSPEQAVSELQAGWPNSDQAVECIRTMFVLFGRLGEHAAAARQIRDMEERCPERKQHVRAAEVLSEIAAGKYPDAEVRERAAAATQRVVSDRLRSAYRAEAQLLVTSLCKLAPQDRLLERDGRRFVADLPISAPVLRMPRSALRKVNVIKLELPPGAWRAAAVVGVVVAAGIVNRQIVLKRCDFRCNREHAVAPWSYTVVQSEPSIILAAGPTSSNSLGVYVIGEKPLTWKVALPVSDLFPNPISAGALPGTPRTIGIARGSLDRCYSIEDRACPVLQITNERGDLIGTQHLSFDETVDWGDVRLPLVMLARREHVYLAVGRHLLAITQGIPDPKRIEFPGTICRIAGSAEHTRSRIVVGLDEGACLVWDPAGADRCVSFATDMLAPHVGINRGGYVIAAAGKRVEVFDSKEGKLTFVADYHNLTAPPIAVLTGARTDQFAIMCENGDVSVFEL